MSVTKDDSKSSVERDGDGTFCCGLFRALQSGDTVHRNFALLLIASTAFAGSFILMIPTSQGKSLSFLGGTPLSTVTAIVIGILAFFSQPFTASRTSNVSTMVLRVTLMVTLTAAAGIYFAGSNDVARFRYALYGDAMLWDATFLQWDTVLLGWIFPQGQLALFLETSTYLGPTTGLGRVSAEVLQIMYASYYLWGNALAVYLLVQYAFVCWKPPGRWPVVLSWVQTTIVGDTTSQALTPEQHWRRLMMFSTAWTGTYILNFTLNMIFPAVSPRIYIADQYQHELEGLYFCQIIRSALKGAAANSFSAFPSGHCGLSWLPTYMAYRMGFGRYHKILRVAAVLITTATIVLRYHYFVDVLGATILLAFGMLAGNLYSQPVYDSCVMGKMGANKTPSEAVALLVA